MSAQVQRSNYLDNLRVACMLGIVFYHVTGLGDPGFLKNMGESLMSPALKTFFLVSGYFSLKTLQDRGLPGYLRSRILSLAVPLTTVMILINPVLHYLRYGFNEGVPYGSYSLSQAISGSISGRWDGYELHLWFLVILLIYVLLLPAVVPVVSGLARRIDKLSPAALACGFALCVAFYAIISPLLTNLFGVHRLVWPFFGYLPYFIAGALAARSTGFLRAIHQIPPMLLLLAVAGLAMSMFYRGPGWGYAERLGDSLMTVTIVICLLALFRRFLDGANAFSRMLSRSIYTVYLLHTLIMFLILAALGIHAGQVTIPLVSVLFLVSTTIPIAVHIFLIERSALLSLLFNGKLPPRSAQASGAN